MALETNLFSYWKLDESSGNAVDTVDGSDTLTNNNTVTYSAGKINNGANFGSSNTNKYLGNTNALPFTAPHNWSISCWVNVTTAPAANTSQALVNLYRGTNGGSDVLIYLGYQDISGVKNIKFTDTYNFTGSRNYATTLTPGKWYHLVFTKSSSTNTLYVNGTSVASYTTTTNNNAGTGNTRNIGAYYDTRTLSDFFSGLIDETGVWDRALTSIEVSQLYNSGNGMTLVNGIFESLAGNFLSFM